MNMNSPLSSQRITISLPNYLYRQLIKVVKPGQVSQFVAGAVLEKVYHVSATTSADPWEEFAKLRKNLPKFSRKEIKEAINLGRA